MNHIMIVVQCSEFDYYLNELYFASFLQTFQNQMYLVIYLEVLLLYGMNNY